MTDKNTSENSQNINNSVKNQDESDLRYGFIGLGNMARSLVQGLLNSGVDPQNIEGTTYSEKSAQEQDKELGIKVFSYEGSALKDANKKVAQDSDVVVIAVKPFAVKETLEEIAPALNPETVVVSVAAGVELEDIEAALGNKQVTVRAMPNMAVKNAQGVTGISGGTHADSEAIKKAKSVFEGSGSVHEISEDQQSAMVGASGSAIAFVFYFAQVLEEAAVQLGFTPQEAAQIARETLQGGAGLLDGQKSPQDLQNDVASPNGTTERGLDVLKESSLQDIVSAATKAAQERAEEIGQELKKGQ